MRESQAAQVTIALQAAATQVQRQMERAVMWLRPDGWQARARRNAWVAMVADHQRRHDRTAPRDAVRGPAVTSTVPRAEAR